MSTAQLVFINIYSSQACETTHLKSESFWQQDCSMAAVGWHSYPGLVHHKVPHLTEAWRPVWWFNTRTAGSSHLVTWECKVICENSVHNVLRRSLRLCSLRPRPLAEHLLAAHSGLPPFQSFSNFFSFLSREQRKTKWTKRQVLLSHQTKFSVI